jgi:hypothetical protein
MSAPGPEGCNWQGIPGDRRDYARLGACNVYLYGHERGWVAQGPQDWGRTVSENTVMGRTPTRQDGSYTRGSMIVVQMNVR